MQQLFSIFLICALTVMPAAWADKGGAGHGKGADKRAHQQHEHRQKEGEKRPGRDHDDRGAENFRIRGVTTIAPEKRALIREYYHQAYGARGHCPPGLAKKHNGCLPPGQAKKLWALHKPLPANVVLRPLPHELIVRVGPPPHGHAWGYMDGDILLYSLVGKVVVDAVSALF